ncbi:MAG TPA: hypothetical protein VFG12_17090, partial [Rhodopila sp.]|nr:hypothetical protein [Rhodopila sp.]
MPILVICAAIGRMTASGPDDSAPKVDEMAYYTKVLQPSENVRYVGGLHWMIYRDAILFGVLVIAALIVYFRLDGNQALVALIVAALFLLLAALSFL